MGDRDLTPRQLAVLVAVRENEGANQTVLVRRTGIDRSTLGAMVLRLRRKQLVRRRRNSKDARAYTVTLTEQGHRLLRAAEPIVKRVDEGVLSALTSDRREQFIDALTTVVDAFQDLASQTGEQPEKVGQVGAAPKRRK